MEINCTVIELLPNSTEKVREWAAFLNANHDGALLSLKNEGVTIESAFVVTIAGKDYLIGYMRALDMSQAQAAVKESTLNIDAYHQSFKKACWGERHQAIPISDVSRIMDEERYA